MTRFAAAIAACAFVAAARGADGGGIYREKCASCHGAAGQGTKTYSPPLVGEKSLPQLAGYIARTMPEDAPGTVTGDDAKAVAGYVFENFYSPAAQARSRPPRVELSRLTVTQYRNAVADIFAGFRPGAKVDSRTGLHGEYFNARGYDGKKRLIDRTDPEVKFDFGIDGPKVEKGDPFDPRLFYILWYGSVIAPETGTYEFIVRTEHATKLWVNDPKKPVIDATVKSGADTEYTASLFLLAGRAYPLKLEFAKAKQGVDDSKKKPQPPPAPASMTLLWKRPGRPAEVIPARYLSPVETPVVTVVETAFPPDDRSLGWERGTTVTKDWDAAGTNAALDVVAYVAARLPDFGIPANAPDRTKKLRDFAKKFAELAFRRPLSPDEVKRFIDKPFDATADADEAVKRAVLMVLKSPRFLYPAAPGAPPAYATANRLAFALWDAPPDRELLDAAAANKLSTREQVRVHADRMLKDPRAKAKLRGFLFTWLKLETAPELAKDAKRFPGFDPAAAADLRTSLEIFLDDVVWSDASDFRELLRADYVYMNGRLAKLYGETLPADAGFTKVTQNPKQRAGVVTHPYVLSAYAYTAESSPIHRGVFLARGVLGVTLRPPPDAFTPFPAEAHPGLSTRDRVTLQTKPAACVTCHGVINPLGFALENFDAVGRYRDTEHGKPIDARGGHVARDGKDATFTGPRELAEFLANSPDAHAAFVQQLFHHLAKQPVRAYGPDTAEGLRKSFAATGYNVQKLAAEIATTAALPPPAPEPAR